MLSAICIEPSPVEGPSAINCSASICWKEKLGAWCLNASTNAAALLSVKRICANLTFPHRFRRNLHSAQAQKPSHIARGVINRYFGIRPSSQGIMIIDLRVIIIKGH